MIVDSNSEGVGFEAMPPPVDPAAADYLNTLCQELGALHPKSYEYGRLAKEIADLATEAGCPLTLPLLGERAISGSEAPAVPPGFVGATALQGIEVPARQFEDLIPPLGGEGTYVLDGTQLVTDGDRSVRLLDCRPMLEPIIHDISPKGDEADRLDSRFCHELRLYVDTGWAVNTVRRTGRRSGPCYTRVIGGKARALWGPVKVIDTGEDHVLTVARYGDCGWDASKERALYRRVLGLTLRGVA